MTKDDRLSAEGLDALQQRFQAQSRKAQAYYTVMHQARDIVGSDEAASAWMEKPLAEFNGKSPAQLISDGRMEEVQGYLGGLKTGAGR